MGFYIGTQAAYAWDGVRVTMVYRDTLTWGDTLIWGSIGTQTAYAWDGPGTVRVTMVKGQSPATDS